MNINEIHKEIDNLFIKYKIPALTKNIPMENLHEWALAVAKKFNLDHDDFRQSVAELFWSVAHVQLSLGYALISRQSSEYPKGVQGIALDEKDIPDAITMSEIHFWYHIYNCYECLYRFWERTSLIIKNVCYPGSTGKKYFDQIINDLLIDGKFNRNLFLNDLKNQIGNWNKIANSRNAISHGKSSPFRNMEIQGKISDVVGINGIPIIYLDYSFKSPRKELEHAVDRYRKVLPAIKAMKEFIDNIES